MCFILYFDGCKTLVALQVFLILLPTGTSPPHTRVQTHTPGPEDVAVSDGNSRGSSAGLSVSAGAGAVEPDGRSCRSPPHRPPFTSV